MKVALVEVPDNHVEASSGSYEGKAWERFEQVAYLHQGDPYPEKMVLQLQKGQRGYEPGWYLIGGGSYKRGKFGMELDQRKVQLVQVADAINQIKENTAAKPRVAA